MENQKTTNGDGWVIDLNCIKAKERKAFLDAMNSGEDENIYPFMAKTIKAWPYPLDPADVESYGELGMLDIVEVGRQFAAAFQPLIAKSEAPANGGEVAGEGRRTGEPEGADGG